VVRCSKIEVDVAIICACSLALPAFIDRHLSGGLGKYLSKLSAYLSSHLSREDSTGGAHTPDMSNSNLTSESSVHRRGWPPHGSKPPAGQYVNVDDQIDLRNIAGDMRRGSAIHFGTQTKVARESANADVEAQRSEQLQDGNILRTVGFQQSYTVVGK
jgi:hypothetical protein